MGRGRQSPFVAAVIGFLLGVSSALPAGPQPSASFRPAVQRIRAFAPAARVNAGPVIEFDRDRLAQLPVSAHPVVLEQFPLPDGERVDLEVQRFSVTGPHTQFVTGRSGLPDVPLAFDPSSVVLLRGRVSGAPNSDVFLALADGFSRGHVKPNDGRPGYWVSSWSSAGVRLSAGEIALLPEGSVRAARPDVPLCGLDTSIAEEAPAMPAGARGALVAGTRQIEIALETDNELFEVFGDANTTLTYLIGLMGGVSHIYLRDTNSYYQVNFIRLWPEPNDPYTQPDPLGFFASLWNSSMGHVERDVAELVSGRRDFPYGGIAFLSAVCGNGYSVVGYIEGVLPDDITSTLTGNSDIAVSAHELGHNCSALHTPDYEPPIDQCYPPPTIYQRGEIMSYCSQTVSGGDFVTDLRFTTRIQNEIESFVNGSFCVDVDCNLNHNADSTDITGGTSADANGNGVPDECEDCNQNGVLDPADIAGGTSADVDGSGIPDDCEPDCNGNLIPDGRDIFNGTSADVYFNGVPDECETDCNNNGMADYNELQIIMQTDVNRNIVLDECEDCDGDGTVDLIELAGAHSCWVASSALAVAGQYHSLTGVLMQHTAPVITIGGATDVLVLPDGRVLVGNGFEHRIDAFDPLTGEHLGPFVAAGSGGLAYPAGMTLGPNGNLYVSSRNTHQVLEYAGDTGAFLGIFAAGLVQPYGLTFGPNGNLFVTCVDNRVLEYDGTTGAFVRTFVTTGSGGLSGPRGLTFKADGNLLVAGYFSGRVHEYDGETGAFVRLFTYGGTLYGPWGLRIGPNGNVFVTRDYVGRNHVTSTRIYEYDVRNGHHITTYLLGDDTGLFSPTGFSFAPGWDRDCNVNHVQDNCDITGGASADLNRDGIPDECQVDCNTNGRYDRLDVIPFGRSYDCNWNRTPDECDIASGGSFDCNTNGRPDECEPDCNTNGFADECDVAEGTSADAIGMGGNGDGTPDECQNDCNANLVPDEADVAAGTSRDCNINGRPDECDIAGGTSADCNGNARPDECDIAGGASADCNQNARPDECDISGGTSIDCLGDGTPDECETDCNANGIEDACDLAQGTSADCNGNAGPDECDAQYDCNANGAQDICDVAAGTSLDCNGNERPDECEVGAGGDETVLIDAADLLNVGANCGNGFFNCNNAAQQGFQWMDSAASAVTSVLVEFNIGVNCHAPGTFLNARLNNGAPAFFNTPMDSCNCTAAAGHVIALSLNADGYLPGGLNALRVVNTSTCFGFAPRSEWGGAYARVTISRLGDCNANGIPDDCDIDSGVSTDLNDNALPDECEDCNQNGFPDELDIFGGTSRDCNIDHTPDECEPGGTDCNANGTLDSCDVDAESSNDCNGNGIPDECDIAGGASADADADGIADECETQVCYPLWSGFEPAPPFSTGSFVHGLDYDLDGRAWDNPTNTWSIVNQGCPSSQGKALKGVSQPPPTTDYVTSEWFRSVGGELDCGAAVWQLTFDARSEAQLNPRIDWQMSLRDARNDASAIALHWASTQSNFAGVTTAQGGNGRGRLLVKNPAGSPAFINSGFVLAANACYQVRVVLDNTSGTVQLFVNGTLRVTTTRLESGARRLDYFRVQQLANGQTSGGTNRLALDNFEFCQTGAALPFADCNANCQSDPAEVAAGRARDCNANAVPDGCDIAGGLLEDANANGVADGCITSAVSRKSHGPSGMHDLTIDVGGRIESVNVSTEPRQGGMSHLRIAFDAPPAGPGPGAVELFRQTCAACPCAPGVQANYAPTGILPAAAFVQGSELVLAFEPPALAEPGAYKLVIGPTVAGFASAVEFRVLPGDVSGDRRTNATDRSLVVSAWTGGGFSASADLNLDGAVNADDRTVVVSQWTSPINCAP